jgi:hypothetical protein
MFAKEIEVTLRSSQRSEIVQGLWALQPPQFGTNCLFAVNVYVFIHCRLDRLQCVSASPDFVALYIFVFHLNINLMRKIVSHT